LIAGRHAVFANCCDVEERLVVAGISTLIKRSERLSREGRAGHFRDQTAIVTGGGSGVGAATAVALAAAGARVVLVGRRLEKLEAVARRAETLGASALCFGADLARGEQLAELVHNISAHVGGVDILVHSAGILKKAHVETGSLSDFDRLFNVNVRAAYALTQGLLPSLKSRQGEIVFINSSSGIAAKPSFSQYDASKHALRALADSLRAEVNESGVRVLSIFLGRTASEMQEQLHDEEHRNYRPELLLQPQDVASAIVSALMLPRTAEITDIHVRPMIKS
jgi:NADP-dependent 3-hydroxy acid dehydrogenase YdfG